MSKILPILFAILGLVTGGGAGYVLRPDGHGAETTAQSGPRPPASSESQAGVAQPDFSSSQSEGRNTEFVKLNNQFVIPVVVEARVTALVVLSVTLEIEAGNSSKVYQLEPKLRDAFLTVLFDHANTGGFSGEFTASTKMARLRIALNETAKRVLGPFFRDVLITELVRQDT